MRNVGDFMNSNVLTSVLHKLDGLLGHYIQKSMYEDPKDLYDPLKEFRKAVSEEIKDSLIDQFYTRECNVGFSIEMKNFVDVTIFWDRGPTMEAVRNHLEGEGFSVGGVKCRYRYFRLSDKYQDDRDEGKDAE